MQNGIDQCKTCLSTNSLDRSIIRDVERICGIESLTIDNNMMSAKDLANRIMHTCFMGTTHSSQATRNRALQLATEIGVYHCDANMNPITQAFENVFQTMTGKKANFVAHGGSYTEDLALQNIQARSRMVYAYQIAQLLPWVRSGGKRSGFLLVLGSANVDEALRDTSQKYDVAVLT